MLWQDIRSMMEKPAFSVPAKKMAMWLFIIADSATFAACLVAYGFLRNGTPSWPRPFHSITNVALMTFILVTSSLTMLLGWTRPNRETRRELCDGCSSLPPRGAVRLLHIREWLGLIGEGMTLFKNPWGTGIFGASFFSITGLHLLHVTGGVIALMAVAALSKVAVTMRMTSKSPACTGTSWIWCGCLWCRSSIC